MSRLTVEEAGRLHYEERKTIEEIANLFGVSVTTVKRRLRKYREQYGVGTLKPNHVWEREEDERSDLDRELSVIARHIEFDSPGRKRAKKSEGDWRTLLERARRVARERKEMSPWDTHATVRVKTKSPIAVVFSGDWHLGDAAVSYEEWAEHMRILLETDGIYLVNLGDVIQNMRRFKVVSAVLAQALTPDEQVMLIRGLVDELTQREKLLASVLGNHDIEFDERSFGSIAMRWMFEKSKAPVFDNIGLLRLNVGNVEYRLLLFHKSRFRSFLRPTHGAYREYTLHYPADIVAGGHDHKPGIEYMWHYTAAREYGDKEFGGMSILIKVGAFQHSAWAQRYFRNHAVVTPVVILWPDEKRMLAVPDMRTASALLEKIRGRG